MVYTQGVFPSSNLTPAALCRRRPFQFPRSKPKVPIYTTLRVEGGVRSNVRDGDRARRGRDGGQDLAVLLNVDERRARGPDGGAAVRGRGRAGERDAPEVGERHEAAARGEVLDDPLRVVLAERGLARERVRHGLAGRLVRDRRLAGRLRRRGHGHLDRVARLEADAGEVVRPGGEPLVPGWERENEMISGQVGHEKGKEAYRCS